LILIFLPPFNKLNNVDQIPGVKRKLMFKEAIFPKIKAIKMKFIIVTIFLSFSQLVFSQENLKAYYDNTHKAENYIFNNRLDSAHLYFRNAFSYVAKPFARHLYISTIVNLKLRQFKNVSASLVSLLELGMPFEKIKVSEIFSEYLQSKEGKRLVERHKKIKHTYDKAYRLRIMQMVEKDQFFRTKPEAYTKYGNSIKKIDRENIDTLLMLIHTKGFPTEQKIGIDENLTFAPLFSLLFIHQSSGPLQQYDFSELLRQNVRNGSIENKDGYYLFNRVSGGMFMSIVNVQYVKIIDSTRSRANPNNHIVLQTSDWGYFPLAPKEKEKEDLKREDFFLQDYDDSLKKALFGLKNTDFELIENMSSKSTLLMYKQEHYDAQILDIAF